jgi:hypothetical protein
MERLAAASSSEVVHAADTAIAAVVNAVSGTAAAVALGASEPAVESLLLLPARLSLIVETI